MRLRLPAYAHKLAAMSDVFMIKIARRIEFAPSVVASKSLSNPVTKGPSAVPISDIENITRDIEYALLALPHTKCAAEKSTGNDAVKKICANEHHTINS